MNEVCAICGWTNVSLINLGEPNNPKMVCLGCCKRAIERPSRKQEEILLIKMLKTFVEESNKEEEDSKIISDLLNETLCELGYKEKGR